MTYGIIALPEKDPFLTLSEDVVGRLAKIAIPGNYLVDLIPLRGLFQLVVIFGKILSSPTYSKIYPNLVPRRCLPA